MKIVIKIVAIIFALIQFFVAIFGPFPKSIVNLLLFAAVTLWLIHDWKKSKNIIDK